MAWSFKNGRPAVLTLFGVALAWALTLRPAPGAGHFTDTSSAIDALLGGSGADGTRARAREALEWIEPAPIVRHLADLGYRVEINARPRDGHWTVPVEMDYHGGFTRTGRHARLIVVSEQVRDAATGRWYPTRNLDQTLDHEIGHALDADVDGSASTEFVQAWETDFAQIPPELKTSYTHEGRFSPFRYFVYADGGYRRARGETFAEAYAVLLQGDRARSGDAFRQHFPRAMASTRHILEKRFGRLFRPDPS